MKKRNTLLPILFFSVLGFAVITGSCKKDKEDDPVTKTDLLTSGSWKFTAFTVDPPYPIFDDQGNIIGTSDDVLGNMDDCSVDDVHSFKADNTFIFDEGASKCDSDDPQSISGTWSFKTNETVLSITQDGYTQDNVILELTERVLKVKYVEDDSSTNYTYTLTFSH